jgi:hypothetical protein
VQYRYPIKSVTLRHPLIWATSHDWRYDFRAKGHLLSSLLEITYPIFIILFTAVLLRKFHLSFAGSIGVALILVGGAIVVLSRGQ